MCSGSQSWICKGIYIQLSHIAKKNKKNTCFSDNPTHHFWQALLESNHCVVLRGDFFQLFNWLLQFSSKFVLSQKLLDTVETGKKWPFWKRV